MWIFETANQQENIYKHTAVWACVCACVECGCRVPRSTVRLTLVLITRKFVRQFIFVCCLPFCIRSFTELTCDVGRLRQTNENEKRKMSGLGSYANAHSTAPHTHTHTHAIPVKQKNPKKEKVNENVCEMSDAMARVGSRRNREV